MITPQFPTLDVTAKYAAETACLDQLMLNYPVGPSQRRAISDRATTLINRIRSDTKPSLMEQFLAEYGLSTREGIALMCLAEAMLRVPDSHTIDALIKDKVAPSEWGKHIGTAASSLVNASTWALMLTGKVLNEDQPGVAGVLRGTLKRLGEPVIRSAVQRAMKEMGRQFVLGETIQGALKRGIAQEAKGYTYSFDMLGEAARTQTDADRYAREYRAAITEISKHAKHPTILENPGISIKFSALHPRYEVAQQTRVLDELVPVVTSLAYQAKDAGIALHIDAEEQDRLVLSLKVIEAVLQDETLAGWDGFGVVVQAYGKRASATIDALYAMATRYNRKINIRLVKGAYWDTEMKQAQVAGMPDFPLFTSKVATDVSYICLIQKLFDLNDRLFPQFATHNAHTIAAVLELAQGRPFELQRLHGMGEQLHDLVRKETNGHCRIYAPVGAHRDLLAYLVRRLLENGANSSFVHQIVDDAIPASEIAKDPFADLPQATAPASLMPPSMIFGPSRVNSRGWDVFDDGVLSEIDKARSVSVTSAGPMTVRQSSGDNAANNNPSNGQVIAQITQADPETISNALEDARTWQAPPAERAAILRRAADLYETDYGAIFSTLAKEAGKTIPDAIGELREAVDFLRYYANIGDDDPRGPRGIICAISPWNFPLAIFTGQIAAALMAGNAVLAKPAEQTPLIAAQAVALLHQAGVPKTALQLLPGPGATVGNAITQDPRVAGVVFTGSTDTAKTIARNMAKHLPPGTPLIAETGGLNAMIVDSTALPEQAVRDIVASAFQSAGQRCSALRCLYLQEDIAEHMIDMIKGAMDELTVGDPWALATDIGPVIDATAQSKITDYIAQNASAILHQLNAPKTGTFVPPTLIRTTGITALKEEIFGPVLHIATYKAKDLAQVVTDVNARGFGLTFGLHSRIDDRVQWISDKIRTGNTYINRNQIGAIVGSQPFGGEGLSGTGPKAGGALYVNRFFAPKHPTEPAHNWGVGDPDQWAAPDMTAPQEAQIATHVLPGPTGELNRLTYIPRPPILCLGPGETAVQQQAEFVEQLGGQAQRVTGAVTTTTLAGITGISGVIWWGDETTARAYATALAARKGPILALITDFPDLAHIIHERHMCVDTTSAGGNVELLAS